MRWLDSLLHDVHHAWRSLLRSPGVIIVSTLSLGLGIGLNLTLYSAASTIFFHTPTMAEPNRVVGVDPGTGRQWSYLNYRDVRDAGIFQDAMAFRTGSLTWRTGDVNERVSVLIVSANFFEGLGARAQIG